jgi:hypothetical protein
VLSGMIVSKQVELVGSRFSVSRTLLLAIELFSKLVYDGAYFVLSRF